MLRYLILTLIISALNSNAMAYLSNEECVLAYRDAAVELRDLSSEFNERGIDRYQMSLEVTRVSTQVNAHALACKVVEDPNARRCLDSAKALYDSIRKEINVRSIGFGNQTEVRLRLDFIPKLTIHDLRC